MQTIYLDNGATSFPKAFGVAQSMADFLLNNGCNINRGAYEASYEAVNTVYETREMLCAFFNFNQAENVVFTKNITEALNILIKGLFKAGDHILVSSMEHNAVMRPLNSLKAKNIEFTKIPCNSLGELNPIDIPKYIKPNTKGIVMTHASNVCGTILNIEEVGAICQKNNLYFIVDSAQTAGFCPLDYPKIKADALCFTGHKGLLGPQGIGGFIANSKIAQAAEPLIDGGTGSLSEMEYQPAYMPDKFEAGTLNIPGVYGLNAALKYLEKTGLKTIQETELMLLERFLEGVLNLPKLRIIGKKTLEGRTAIVSLDFPTLDNAAVAYELAKDYGIMTRCGLHCAPSAHKTLNTFPQGTVRFSFSHFNTKKEIDFCLECINKIIKSA